MKNLDELKSLLKLGRTSEAISQLDELLVATPEDDTLHYLRGNAFRKQGDYQQALNCYLEAIALNPESPAVHARQMIMEILDFYNKDMYNH